MSQRFSYVKYDAEAQSEQQAFKTKFEELEAMVDQLPEGRAKPLCLTKLEEAYMWTGKSIRDSQIKRSGECVEQTERGNE